MSRWKKRIILREDMLFAVKGIADYLMSIVKGRQELPYQPKTTVFNLYAEHMEKIVDNKPTEEMWIGQLLIASKDEQDFASFIGEVQTFLKTRGRPYMQFIIKGRDVKLDED
jgi:hypothetical protein